MKGVILDAASLGTDVDFSSLEDQLTELVTWPATTPDEAAERIEDAEVVITNKVQLTRELLQQAPKLRLICVLATGTNNIDLDAADELGIAVRNVAAYGTASVAQHTLMMMLSLTTRQPQYQSAVAAGEWQKAKMFCLMDYPVIQLQGKTLVIVGHGELGQAVARLAEAFGMQIEVAARPGRSDDPRPSLDDLLPQADVISFHCPLTDVTRDLLNKQRFARCKPSLLVLNAARGGIVNEKDAIDALRNGQIGGLAVDVLSEEPPRHGNPLLDAMNERLNLIVTPHSAWLAPEARQRIVELTATNIAEFKKKDSRTET
ncbi:glycerate dehydrogenase [Aliidiomarina sedimenti]|uniref:Glycerate dehydrogenase n=1 Tax=Aliidiomarina sedimenti TaxID=1933879 RepID=A0ABY0BVI1_9GAMM|nr:D-2-hydroxyacid dehydrogenase [Aliidiomarina sedimenti]RUO28125.1 glycerate dehydrogenase [Aliidiomarina sedimenti]